MREESAASFEPRAGYRLRGGGVLDRLFGLGVQPLQMEDAVFDAVVAGWRAQQRSRGNKTNTVEAGCVWCAGSVITRSCGRGSGARLWWRSSCLIWRPSRGRAGPRRFATTSRGSARSWTT